jgi:hypothetical protein
VRIGWVFFCYSVYDLCHDQLLGPGRALLVELMLADPTVPQGDDSAEVEAEFQYTRVQMFGRTMALLVGCLPSMSLGDLNEFQILFVGAFVVLFCSSISAWVGGDGEIPLTELKGGGSSSEPHEGGPKGSAVVSSDFESPEEGRAVLMPLLAILLGHTVFWVCEAADEP